MIANLSTIEAADLDTAFQEHVAALAAENRRDAGCYQLGFDFVDILDVTPAALRSQTFTVGDDDVELLNMGASFYSFGAVMTLTLGGGPLITGPITLSYTHIPDPVWEAQGGDMTRYNDGTKPRQVLLRGATYTVTVSTTSTVAAPNVMRAFLLLRTIPRRR